MTANTLLEVLWASTHTWRVMSKFRSRGGIMLVAPPGALKTSLIRCIEEQPGVLAYSDMTTTTLVEARDLIASNKVRTLAFYDMQKLYERRADTASNIVGNIRALMDEGFTTASFEATGAGMIQARARALIIAATTPSMYRKKHKEWLENGFARRLLFSVYHLSNPDRIVEAILKDNPIELLDRAVSIGPQLTIDLKPRADEASERLFRRLLKHQSGDEVPLILLRKIHAVLDWKYSVRLKQPKRRNPTHKLLEEFGESLQAEGAELTI